jgi:hypothetical protein
MGRMRIALGATLATVAALVAANMLGVASAEAPTGTPVRTVSVQGTGSVPVAQGAGAAVATAAYRLGMAAALADGQNKAEFLTSKTGTGLGPVQSIAEGGGYISCSGGPGGPEGEYVEYTGEQPDFGSSPAAVPVLRSAAAAPRPALGRPTLRHKRRKRRPTAKRATAGGCTLTTQVSLVYTIV